MKYWIFVLLFLYGTSVAQTNEECMECHEDPELTAVVNDTVEVSAFVDIDRYSKSIHADFSCIDCHSDIEEIPHEDDLKKVDCSQCHEDVAQEYSRSIHAAGHKSILFHTATCSDCHGKHDIFPADDPRSHTYALNIENTCGACHKAPDLLSHLGIRGEGPVEGYSHSIHEKILHKDPNSGAATCNDCHGSHDIYLMTDPRSKFNKLNRSRTCGACHTKVQEEYEQSIHWEAVQRGHFESPVCNDCHGEHQITHPSDETSITNRLNLSSQLCAKCHSSPTMMSRFGLDPGRFDSYMKTYHGLAVLKGSTDAANCTSCHEVHAIRSQKDPESSIYKANLSSTCSKCHENVNGEFSKISVHPVNQQARNPYAYIIKQVYTWLIIILIGGMVIHNLIIIAYFIKRKYHSEKQQQMIQRFKPFEVYQHALMFVSFTILAITGFALKYSGAFWAQWLHDLGMTEALRALIHRVAAIIMVTVSVVQLIYLLFFKSGRKEIRALIPTYQDIRQFVQTMAFYLNLRSEKPKYNRFDYTEKAEYLALIWGVAVMAITGFILWFPGVFVQYLPWWTFEVAEVIHLFEAILATLAIVVWHWFFVIFHPEVYPVKLTFLHGKITRKDHEHHHGNITGQDDIDIKVPEQEIVNAREHSEQI